jgi:photosynthesis system II assembly factor YCF48-like protein
LNHQRQVGKLESLKGSHPQSVTFDPRNPNRVYCGTFGDGLWKSDDGGQSWHRLKNVIFSNEVTSVSASRIEQENRVYVGTEPAALYRSDDGGESWQRMSNLNNLDSSTSWSFPPRPWTSHVRWIELDVSISDYVFVAIEAGALVRSLDGGRTWIDRVEQGPYDTHTLGTHQNDPKRLYSSAGDGYFESFDYGESWERHMTGLKHKYIYGLAIDPVDPNIILVSASESAWQAHNVERANSLIYRSAKIDGREWKAIANGLPESGGTIIAILAANPNREFYAISNRGLFCSNDTGLFWRNLDVSWSKEYLSQHPRALAIQ